MSPRFGFRTGSLPGATIEESIGKLAEIGYDCAELCLEPFFARAEELSESRCAAIRRALDSAGVTIASASYHGDSDEPSLRAANQRLAVQAARRLGADILVLNGERVIKLERQWAEHVARFRALAELAEREKVVLAVEPEPKLVIGSSADMAALIKAVGSPRLKVNLDIGHALLTDPDLAETVRQLGAAIVHLHLEDMKRDVHKHLLFGEGDIDFPALRTALAEIGYRGPYVADLFGQADAVTAATRALADMRRIFA
jgi:sugar phosphate isomerase/epimerase